MVTRVNTVYDGGGDHLLSVEYQADATEEIVLTLGPLKHREVIVYDELPELVRVLVNCYTDLHSLVADNGSGGNDAPESVTTSSI